MNKQLLLTMLAVLCVLFSVSAVCASEINVTDSYATSLVDDTSDVSVYNYTAGSDFSVSSNSNVGNDSSKVSLSSEEVLRSADSNTLSTDTDSKINEITVVSTNILTSFINEDVVDSGVASNDDGTSVEVADKDLLGASAKKDVYFVAPNRTVRVDEMSNGYTYPIVLKDINGKALPNQKVTLTFNGVRRTATTDSTGWAYFDLSISRTNTYPITLSYAGDSNYNARTCEDFTYIKVEGIDVYFVAPNRTLYLDEISKGYSYPVVLKDIDGHNLANKKVTLVFNGQTYTETTDSKGWAYFDISVKEAGKYKVTLKFASDRYYNSLADYSIATILVKSVDVYFIAPNRTVSVEDISKGYKYPVVLKDEDGHNLANEKIYLYFGDEKYVETTDSSGWAYFNIKTDKIGTYKINLKFPGDGRYNSKSSYSVATVKVEGIDVYFVAPNRTLNIDDISKGYSYPIILKDVKGHKLANKEVALYFNGERYVQTTDSNGWAYFTISTDKIGKYKITLKFASDGYYNSKSSYSVATVKVEGYDTKVAWMSGTSFEKGSQTFNVLLTDSNGAALANQVVTLTVNSNTYSATTASNGYATFNLNLDAKAYTVSYKYAGDNRYNPSKGSIKITVNPSAVAINDILVASETVKTYYYNNDKLPNSVNVGGTSFTMPEFLYLISQAIYQLGNSNSNPIPCIMGVKAPGSPSGDNLNAQLTKANYLSVAKSVADYIKSNNQAPNYASANIGKIHYVEVVDAFSRVLAFYKNNDKYLPNYVTVTYGSSKYSGPVNVPNTITDLTPYYQSTKNCQVNNSQIKSLVNSLTKGITSAEKKAIVLYNYVRDHISYSFYYNTRYGAVGTLNAGVGNCVDQAHLLVAMYRTAGLAARYEFGTCTFSDGTFGHVWTQVLIDNTWVCGDPVSTRNSFGVVNNWNVYSYSHHGYYASLPF